MKVVVRLFGTLGQGFPGYKNEQGMDLELPEGASVKDLLAVLATPKSQKWMAVLDGRMLKADTLLKDTDRVHVVPAVFGG
ncbi:MAG: MoaD/ThiS family protein [Deltaproteobacteria bacterium]|nr:MoaD/ThiS family protein [Deltaproteobacteria bacterium]